MGENALCDILHFHYSGIWRQCWWMWPSRWKKMWTTAWYSMASLRWMTRKHSHSMGRSVIWPLQTTPYPNWCVRCCFLVVFVGFCSYLLVGLAVALVFLSLLLLNTSAFDRESLSGVRRLCWKHLCLIVPCVSSYRWVLFSRAILFCQPHQQLFTHSLLLFVLLLLLLYCPAVCVL